MELSNWLLVAIAFMGLILSIMVPLIANILTMAKATDKELARHQTHVAEQYATKHDVRELGDRMERQMKDGFENLKQLLTRNNKDAA
jgi:hypothetical protein